MPVFFPDTVISWVLVGSYATESGPVVPGSCTKGIYSPCVYQGLVGLTIELVVQIQYLDVTFSANQCALDLEVPVSSLNHSIVLSCRLGRLWLSVLGLGSHWSVRLWSVRQGGRCMNDGGSPLQHYGQGLEVWWG